MKSFFIACCFSLFLFGKLEAISQNSADKQENIIKNFLRVLMLDSEAGYVFFDKKPICVHGFHIQDSFCINSDLHKEMVAVKAGSAIWKRLKKDNSKFIIHVSQKEDPEIPNTAHILIINVPLFHQVVNENLSLFQYILDPTITSKALLKALVEKDQPFHSLLKYNKVLIGILLGFGTKNSLVGSRFETIYETFQIRYPPFLPAAQVSKVYDEEYLPFSLGLSYKTLKEEANNLATNFRVSSSALQERKPNFIFGWQTDESNNKKFILDLEETQKKIQKIMKTKEFDVSILEKLLGKNYSFPFYSSNNSSNQDDINYIVAKGILNSLATDDREYLRDFIEGMKNPHSTKLFNLEKSAFFSSYLRNFLEAGENLKIADNYFQTLSNQRDYQCLVPFKLYYKTLELDNAQKINQGTLVTLTCTIYSPLGHCLGHYIDKVINLKNTIPGFGYGVKGMAIGETREIFIHPSLAYGFDETSDAISGCTYLKAIVTLHDIHNDTPLTPSEPLNLDFLFNQETLNKRKTNYRKSLQIKGATIASHLSNYSEINLEEIQNHLVKLNLIQEISTSPQEQEIINQIHYNIYFPWDR